MTDLTITSFSEVDESLNHANALRQLKTPQEISEGVDSATAALSNAAAAQAYATQALGRTSAKPGDLLASAKTGISSSANTTYAPSVPESASGVTITTDITTPTLSKVWNKEDSNISYLAGEVSQKGASYPDNLFMEARAPESGSGVAITPSWVVSFLFYGDAFELKYKVVTGALEVMVDGKSSGVNYFPSSTGQIRYLRAEFSSVALRRIDIVCNNTPTGDLLTDDTDSVQQTLNPKRVVVAGDSFTEGRAGASAMGLGYVDRLRELSGCWDMIKTGSGGTGWVKENGGRPNLLSRAQTDIVDYDPDIVIIAMGINDNTDITQNVSDTLDIVQAGVPNATIVLLGSWTDGDANAQMVANTSIIESAAQSRNIYFINPTGTGSGDGWLTGTGNAGSPAADGNADVFVSSDGTHPNDAGHLFLAQRLYNALLAQDIKL